jgi:hypothetical protein
MEDGLAIEPGRLPGTDRQDPTGRDLARRGDR